MDKDGYPSCHIKTKAKRPLIKSGLFRGFSIILSAAMEKMGKDEKYMQEMFAGRLPRFPKRGIFFAAVGLVMMGFGVYRGEMEVVLEKAIHICMECIGIG